MTVQRGDIWMANLNPTRGTVLTIPLTTNLRWAALPSCVRVEPGEGGLESASVLLCHQLRVLDKTRLQRKLGTVSPETIASVERCVLFTMGMTADF